MNEITSQHVSLKVWITRPDSSEIYLGGARNLQVWMERPTYSFDPIHTESRGKTISKPTGWCSPRQFRGAPAEPLLSQSPALLQKVWAEIAWSCAPRGTNLEEVHAWAQSPASFDDTASDGDTAWRVLFKDRTWEQKCNVPAHRFLLEVDLVTGLVSNVSMP